MATTFINTENKTGWIAYYICDQSGIGFDRPNYLYLPWTDPAEIKAQILDYHESWVEEAHSFQLKVELGVVPPVEILESEIKELSEAIDYKTTLMAKFIQQKDEFHAGLVRN